MKFFMLNNKRWNYVLDYGRNFLIETKGKADGAEHNLADGKFSFHFA